MEKTTLEHKSEVKRSNWQPPTHTQVRRHSNQSSCSGCGSCRKIASSANASASIMLKSLDPGKKVCATSFLQRTYGNQYVQRLIQTKKDSPCLQRCGSRTIQMKASGCCGGCANHGKEEEKTPIHAKLTIGPPGDKYEQEADRVSEQVMRMPEPQIQRQPMEEEEEELQMKSLSEQITPIIQRQPEEEEEELQAKEVSSNTPNVTPDMEVRLNAMRGGGQPLPVAAKSFMETRFGSDFSGVRVHTNGDAVQMNRELNAEAFTHGRDIYFGTGRYSPGTSSGKRLLAHELTHVIQQHTGVNFSPTAGRKAKNKNGFLQCYKLKGFPSAKASQMHKAIKKAISKVKKCKYLSWYGKRSIPVALITKRYDYKPKLKYCGWTFPSSWYIEVGKSAFTSSCCDLASTLAHEAAHTVLYTEGKARKMECKCFGCSC